jgi:hypothetical protein
VNRKSLVLLLILLFLVLLAWLTRSMMSAKVFRCEVCMSYEGRTQCKIASGETREEAQRTATDAACTLIASGVTETQACTRSVPASITWLERGE